MKQKANFVIAMLVIIGVASGLVLWAKTSSASAVKTITAREIENNYSASFSDPFGNSNVQTSSPRPFPWSGDRFRLSLTSRTERPYTSDGGVNMPEVDIVAPIRLKTTPNAYAEIDVTVYIQPGWWTYLTEESASKLLRLGLGEHIWEFRVKSDFKSQIRCVSVWSWTWARGLDGLPFNPRSVAQCALKLRNKVVFSSFPLDVQVISIDGIRLERDMSR